MFLLAYIVTFLGQLLFWGADTYFFSAVILSKQLLIRSKTSTDQLPLERRQLQYTIYEGKFAQKIRIYRRVSFLKQTLLQNIKFLEQLLFQQSFFLKRGTFPEQLLFHECYFWKQLILFRKVIQRISTFSGQLLFQSNFFLKKATLSQYNISKEVLFHSFVSNSSY